MAYTINASQVAGVLPIANIDSGVTFANASSAAPSPPLHLGMIVRASDPTYGEGEFILLAGVASTVVGSVVTYNTTSYTTALAPAGTNLPQPIAIAMSANTSASTWGWYQISGIAVVQKQATSSLAVGSAIGISATGVINASATGAEVQGALMAATAATAATTAQIVINRPHMQGRIT